MHVYTFCMCTQCPPPRQLEQRCLHTQHWLSWKQPSTGTPHTGRPDFGCLQCKGDMIKWHSAYALIVPHNYRKYTSTNVCLCVYMHWCMCMHLTFNVWNNYLGVCQSGLHSDKPRYLLRRCVNPRQPCELKDKQWSTTGKQSSECRWTCTQQTWFHCTGKDRA